MLKKKSIAILVGPLMLFSASAGYAQDRNPFDFPELADRLEIASQERLERIVSESMVEFREGLVADLNADMDGRIDEIVETLSGRIEAAASDLSATAAGVEPADILRPGSVFVACVDDRPLYRDGGGVPYYPVENVEERCI